MLPLGTALYKHQHSGNNPMKKKEIHYHSSGLTIIIIIIVIISIKELLYAIKLCLCPNESPIVIVIGLK